MSCQRCQSDRIADVSAKCSDACFMRYAGAEHDGYVPSEVGIGGGDYIELKYCLECGHIQGEWPVSDAPLNEMRMGTLERQRNFISRQLRNYVGLTPSQRSALEEQLKGIDQQIDALSG